MIPAFESLSAAETSSRFPPLSKGVCISLMLLFAINAQADGISENQAIPDNISIQSGAPALDQPVQMLANGQIKIWDPQTGLWQSPGNDLRFDPDQRISYNKTGDGRVLFFATREGGDAPEYQARVWNPQSGVVEKVMVSAKAKFDTDIAVLADGRVLIINGSEGSADIWDSSTNTVTHTEEPLLENSRWRILPFKNKQALLIETFPDDPAAIRRSISSSVTLLWNPGTGEWKQVADLPTPFMDSGKLTELAGGSVQSENSGKIYRLTSIDGSWEQLSMAAYPIGPSLDQTEIHADSSNYNAPALLAKNQLSSKAELGGETFSWKTYREAITGDLWILVLSLTWIAASTVSFYLKIEALPFSLRTAVTKLYYLSIVVFTTSFAWVFIRHAPIKLLQPLATSWWENNRDDIAVIVTALAIFGPIILYFILRRMEEEALSAFLNKASKTTQTIFIGAIAYLVIYSITEDYSQLKHQSLTPPDEISWFSLNTAIGDHKWVILAIIVPTIAYFFLRELKAEKIDHTARIWTARIGKFSLFVAVIGLIFLPISISILFTVYTNKQDKLGREGKSCSRSVINDPVSINKIQKWIQCVDSGQNLFASLFYRQIHQTKEVVMSLPSAPCRFIGVWTSTRADLTYKSKVTLTDDNRYASAPMWENAFVTHGFWGANGERMVWFEDHRFVWPIDLNTIHPESRSRFSLIDVNGKRTDFELIDAIKSNTCSL